jgi:hypothetical protein
MTFVANALQKRRLRYKDMKLAQDHIKISGETRIPN